MATAQKHPEADAVRRVGAARKVLRSAIVIGVLASVAGAGTFAAFSSTTDNTANQFRSGTVVISDNDAGSALFDLSGMDPVDPTVSRCIVATYSGSLASTVRLYGTTGGTLGPYLSLKVTRGTIPVPSGSSCDGFTADADNHRSLGAGVLFDGTLEGFPDDYAGGLVDPVTATPESWTTGEAHAYRFDVVLQDTNEAQGREASQVFTWEARNQ